MADTHSSEFSDNLGDAVLLYLAVHESCILERQHGGQRCKEEAAKLTAILPLESVKKSPKGLHKRFRHSNPRMLGSEP